MPGSASPPGARVQVAQAAPAPATSSGPIELNAFVTAAEGMALDHLKANTYARVIDATGTDLTVGPSH